MGNQHEFDKAVSWILSGNPVVIVHRQYVDRIERELKIKLKRLSNDKYLILCSFPEKINLLIYKFIHISFYIIF